MERWAEDSGNAALMGRELPPDEVLACDQRICWWAGELRKAGLEGGMDELRARAFLDLVLGKDSRPRPDGTAAPAASDSTASDSAGRPSSDRAAATVAAAAAQAAAVQRHGAAAARRGPAAGRRAGSPGGSR